MTFVENDMEIYEIIDYIEERNPNAKFLDGLDEALVGYSEDDEPLAVYSLKLIIDTLIKNDDMTERDAMEWYDFNIVRSLPYFGDNSPIIFNCVRAGV